MDYVINALGLPFNGDTLKTRSLGGSESAAYYLARELARRGHRVCVFTSDQAGGVSDGVSYNWCGPISAEAPLGAHFDFYARNTPHDVLIVQRHPLAFDRRYASKINLWQTHDLALHRTAAAIGQMTWNMDAATVVSEWHKQQLCGVYPIGAEFVHVVPNGVDPELYAGPFERFAFEPSDQTDTLQLLYQSRPERGLEHLVRPGGIMDRLRGLARLHVCGYDNTTEEMAPYYAQLEKWAHELPNVTWHGALTKARLADLQRSCDVLAYPTEFEEVSCITAMEAMHAALPMVASDHAALPETCRYAGVELLPLKDGYADEDAFVAWLTMVANDLRNAERTGASVLAQMREAQRAAAHSRTWRTATDALEQVVQSCLERKSPTAVARHLLKQSDVATFEATNLDRNAITDRLHEEVDTLFAFRCSEETYAAHYDRHGGQYYDDTPLEHLRRAPEGSARWQAALMLLSNAIEAAGRPGLKVLDYGCAHGHYTIPLAQRFERHAFHGVDINARAIQEAIAWSGEAGVGNVSFSRGSGFGEDTYDVILLGEVLEHVRDPYALLEDARAHLNEGGALITTTPYGPWEWIGHEAYKHAREHWQHFERQDLVEIFADMNPEIVCAPAGAAPGGSPTGSWCCRVYPGAQPFGRVDIGRKLRETVPEQTVSACLIVKDGERSLRKALDSLVPWVSEVIIGIDPATTDDTVGIIERFAAANPWLPVTHFTGYRATVVGFAAARNAVVDKAVGDWILWMDADEELIGGDQLPKLLRNNVHDAYSTPQIHFSIQPAQVLTTDFPSRLYRNRRGIRFYGLVHEHPESKPGDAIASATARPEVQFCHNGYVTEDIRRARYFRNLPLLLRDIDENPDRLLNKFLLIRDLAQGIGFELQQTGGRLMPNHRERATRVIDLWRELLANPKPVGRMLIDALQYYTMAAEVIGGWFEADVSFAVQKLSLNTRLGVRAKFVAVADFTQLIARLSKEATSNYESVHL